MRHQDMMPVKIDVTAMWTLSSDRRSIRLTLPRLPLAHMAQPVTIVLDVEASTVDEIIDRLTVLRADAAGAAKTKQQELRIRIRSPPGGLFVFGDATDETDRHSQSTSRVLPDA